MISSSWLLYRSGIISAIHGADEAIVVPNYRDLHLFGMLKTTSGKGRGPTYINAGTKMGRSVPVMGETGTCNLNPN